MPGSGRRGGLGTLPTPVVRLGVRTVRSTGFCHFACGLLYFLVLRNYPNCAYACS